MCRVLGIHQYLHKEHTCLAILQHLQDMTQCCAPCAAPVAAGKEGATGELQHSQLQTVHKAQLQGAGCTPGS